ncbi:MAG: hypothetical protein R2830_11415 [Saprospiraceae bacterium]
MKKLYFTILTLVFGISAQAQYIFKIAGDEIKVTGNAQVVLKNTDWQNNGTFTATNGTVKLTGDAAAPSIGGTSETTFHHLEIDKTAGTAQLNQAAGVDSELRMTSGNLDLNGYDLTLGSTNGQIVAEKESSRITGPNGGEVIKTVTLNAPNSANPGNIGLEITSTEDLGSTEIRRGHEPQDIPGLEGIERYFTVTPTNNAGLDADVRFHYFDGELNGLTESELEPWREDGSNWSNYPATDSDPTANWVETANIATFSTWTLGQGALKIYPKIFLQGPYAAGLMNDDLRSANLLPNAEPYTGLGFVQVGGGGGEMASPGVFAITGNDAIVDWVFLELRDKNSPATVIRTKSALLQRDGDIVDVDGTSAITFPGLAADEYYLAVRHRNHLGIRTAAAQALSVAASSYDFSTGLAQAWDNSAITSNDAMVDLGGSFGLFRADVNANGSVNVADFFLARSQSTPNQSGVYLGTDVNLNGSVNVADFFLARSQSTPNKSAHLD